MTGREYFVVAALILGSIIAGCSRETSSGTPRGNATEGAQSRARHAVIQADPVDLETNFNNKPIRIIVSHAGGDADGTLAQALAKSVEIRHLPDLSTIEGDAVFVPVDAVGENPANGRYALEFTPRLPLQVGWYVLSLSSLPTGVVPGNGWAQVPPVGVVAARFSYASAPTLRTVTVCEKKDGVVRWTLGLSEDVLIDPLGAANSVSVATANTQCRLASNAGESAYIEFDCPATAAAASDTWTVSLSPGIRARTGEQLTMLDGRIPATIALVPQELPLDSVESCRIWRQN